MRNDRERKNRRTFREGDERWEIIKDRRGSGAGGRADMKDVSRSRNSRGSRGKVKAVRGPESFEEDSFEKDSFEEDFVEEDFFEEDYFEEDSKKDLTEDREQRRRQQRRALQRARRAKEVRRQKIIAAVLVIGLALTVFVGSRLIHRAWAKSTLSDAVLGYSSMVEKFAKQEGVEKYVDVLLAIMMVESEGTGLDVMQSSESKGLSPGSLAPEESIEQACIYFAALLQIAGDLGIKDEKALIQSYNYGPGYLTYLSEHGGKHSEKLAIAYAKDMSGGEKVRYLHLYAIKKNGGWIYKFGNMFYETLVQQYL